LITLMLMRVELHKGYSILSQPGALCCQGVLRQQARLEQDAMNETLQGQLRESGFCVIADVLAPAELAAARAVLVAAIERINADGSTFDPRLDPNAANQRVYDLPAHDSLFVELLRHPQGLAAARAACGQHVMISNFTANNALPGSGSMKFHSDQALAVPQPWDRCWTVNVIWCLDDVDEENGATRYVPGSCGWRELADVPEDLMARSVAFTAKAGSIIVMDGRLWHTSGSNRSSDRQRRLMFAYYACDFVRPQANWQAVLAQTVRDSLDEEMRGLFGIGTAGNVRIGGGMTRL